MIGVRAFVRRAAAIAMIAGFVTLGYAGWVVADAWTFQHEYDASAPAADANAPAVVASAPVRPAPLIEGEAIGEIEIARLGLHEVIAEGSSAAVLRRGVGHLEGTPWLGQPGNVVLAGHRDTVFRALRDIHVGDRIDVTTHDRRARYEVASTAVVPPTAVDVLNSTGSDTLTLITCFPFTYIGAAPNRFVVRARKVASSGTAAAAPHAHGPQ